MGIVQADNITDEAGTGAPDFTQGLQLGGTTLGQVSSSNDGLAPQISDGTFNAAAGEIGEVIDSSVTGATVGTASAITSISLTAGAWDITGTITAVGDPGIADAALRAGISATSGTGFGVLGKNSMRTGASPIVAASSTLQGGCTVPVHRILVTSTTTYYLNANTEGGTFSGNAAAYISAVRVR